MIQEVEVGENHKHKQLSLPERQVRARGGKIQLCASALQYQGESMECFFPKSIFLKFTTCETIVPCIIFICVAVGQGYGNIFSNISIVKSSPIFYDILKLVLVEKGF